MKDQARERSRLIETWYRDRYRLPPTDPRFLNLTPAELLLEYWTVHYATQPAGATEFDTPDFDADVAAMMRGDLRMPADDDFEVVTHERN
ncbi:MAG TPA: hypothetical protein PK689_03845 [Kiritimatiellia bacterium]|nr:hypothetical protein [Kiritimatiellia bacterium]